MLRKTDQLRLRSAVTAVLAAALLGACSLAPRYEPPKAQAVERFAEAGGWMPAHPSDGSPRGEWWAAFHEPALDQLEEQFTRSNPDLRAAVARFAEARALALRARSVEFPTVDASASATRERGSGNAPLAALLGGKPSTYDDFVTGLSFAWEIDLFGRLRNERPRRALRPRRAQTIWPPSSSHFEPSSRRTISH